LAHNHHHKLPNAFPRRALPSGAIFNKPPFILFSKTDFFLVTPSRGLPLCPSPVFAPNTHHIIAQKPNSPAFSSTFLVFGTGETRVGDLTGVFFATPPLAATALVFGVLFPGVTDFLDGGVFFAPGVLGFAAGPLLGVALVEARVGVGAAGAATTTAAVVFVGVFDFTGVFVADGVFAGDFAPPALPRNLSLKSLFDRFPSFSLNSLSARILAQAPAPCFATPAASAEVSTSVHADDALRGVVDEDLAFLLLGLACGNSSERRTDLKNEAARNCEYDASTVRGDTRG